MKLEWTEPAVETLQGIKGYIAKDNEFYATYKNPGRSTRWQGPGP